MDPSTISEKLSRQESKRNGDFPDFTCRCQDVSRQGVFTVGHQIPGHGWNVNSKLTCLGNGARVESAPYCSAHRNSIRDPVLCPFCVAVPDSHPPFVGLRPTGFCTVTAPLNQKELSGSTQAVKPARKKDRRWIRSAPIARGVSQAHLQQSGRPSNSGKLPCS